MLRRVPAMVGAVGGATLLSGCVALDLPLVAMSVDDAGTPRALLRPCGDDTYRGPLLTGWAGSFDDLPGDDDVDITLWRAEGERSGDTAFALFSPPPAWGADVEGERRLLPDRTYQLTFTHHEGDYNGTVAFTAGDLSGLGTGQVWADDRAMALDEFEELAEESC